MDIPRARRAAPVVPARNIRVIGPWAAPFFVGSRRFLRDFLLRRPRRNGVRCRGWVEATLMPQECPSKHGSP